MSKSLTAVEPILKKSLYALLSFTCLSSLQSQAEDFNYGKLVQDFANPSTIHSHHPVHRVDVGRFLPTEMNEDTGTPEMIPALERAPLTDVYLNQFTAEGRPLVKKCLWDVHDKSANPRTFDCPSPGLKRVFAQQLNKGLTAKDMTPEEYQKYQSIYKQITLAVDRTQPTPRSYYILSEDWEKNKKAFSLSIDFETKGKIYPNGAYTIANQGTAERQGWGDLPCAESAAEIVRQAYQRAGYNFFDDFNRKDGDPIEHSIRWHVGILARALVAGGWIPWDYTMYRPPVGAVLVSTRPLELNSSEYEPYLDDHFMDSMEGHVYIAAGFDGEFVVDNGGYERGRDLRLAPQDDEDHKRRPETFDDPLAQYNASVFFLPPGINPKPW